MYTLFEEPCLEVEKEAGGEPEDLSYWALMSECVQPELNVYIQILSGVH